MSRHFSSALIFQLLLLFSVAGCAEEIAEATDLYNRENRLLTGVSGADLLTSQNYTNMHFEVVYMEGHPPSELSVTNLVEFAKARCYKPGGVTYSMTGISAAQKETYTIDDILRLEDTYRTRYNQGDEIAVFILALNGRSVKDEGNTVILGTAYRNTSFVIYEETISRFSSEFISNNKTTLESTVLRHEFAHLLGLVNLGAPMQNAHEDASGSNHCEIEECLMNYRTDSGIDRSQVSLGGGVPDLDSQCLADLRALGGK